MAHLQTLTNLNGEYVYIDNNIRPLIVALNELGFTTQCCCENLNNEGQVQVLFDKSVTDQQILKLVNWLKPIYRFSIDNMHPISIRKILTDCGTEIKWCMMIDLDWYQEVEDAILYYQQNKIFLRKERNIIKMFSLCTNEQGECAKIRIPNTFGNFQMIENIPSFIETCAAAAISIYKTTSCKYVPYMIIVKINSMRFVLTNVEENITLNGESIWVITDRPRWRNFFNCEDLRKFQKEVLDGVKHL